MTEKGKKLNKEIGGEINFGGLENKMHRRPVKEDVAGLKFELEALDGGVVPIYIACPEELFGHLVKYLKNELEIQNSKTFEIVIDPNRADIAIELEKLLKDDIPTERDNRIMIVAKGFERLVSSRVENEEKRPGSPSTSYRWGHDYDQNINENSSIRKELARRKIRVIVVTHINTEIAEPLRKTAIATAAGSQFKRGMIVI